MHIFIDESGSFVPTATDGSWCAVAAYVVPEVHLRSLDAALTPLKLSAGKTYRDEVKLRDITEYAYIEFLERIGKLSGTLYCAATEMSRATSVEIAQHRDEQAKRIVANLDKMKYESGRDSYRKASEQVSALSPQLYLQLVCQVEVIFQVIDRAILYYVQRRPKALRKFAWSIDQKNTAKISYEDAFEKVAPGLLQSMSFERPAISLVEGDYSAMRDYIYTKETAPNYLNEVYNLGVQIEEGFNIGKILHSNMSFVDSTGSSGVQVADLLVSGIRRVLRGEFKDQDRVARLLGNLMVQNANGQQVAGLISLASSGFVSGAAERCVRLFNHSARKMMV